MKKILKYIKSLFSKHKSYNRVTISILKDDKWEEISRLDNGVIKSPDTD